MIIITKLFIAFTLAYLLIGSCMSWRAGERNGAQREMVKDSEGCKHPVQQHRLHVHVGFS